MVSVDFQLLDTLKYWALEACSEQWELTLVF